MARTFTPGDPANEAAIDLLEKRIIAWFTTVDADGAPHAVPVWFFWHDGRVVVFSRAATAKVAHVRAGSPVLVHLETGAFGNEVVILRGTAEVSERSSAQWLAHFRPAYEEKYAAAVADYGQPLDAIVATFSTALVFTPETVLAW
ncbi:pyridoxamine 5'-phosphate oxidase family protein [Microbacterium sp. RD1]|uniref:pyridoxamine 5'-phosphate oxidase family protein n=1 Tax=Microbacterium sp. RD1 TaxID=3457313 RepID=UPI003FA5AD06